jgi:hypothetical protein
VFTEQLRSGEMTVEEFDELSDHERHEMRVAFEARQELNEGEERQEG